MNRHDGRKSERVPVALSDEERTQLAALEAMPDSAIDTTELPSLTEAFFAGAERNPFYRPMKRQLTVRVDADVLAWLRSAGRGYQTRINRILREAMLRENGSN